MLMNNTKQLPNKTWSHKNPQYNRLEPDKKQMIKKLLYLFTFYAGKGNRYSCQQLSEKYYMELLGQVWKIAGKDIRDRKLQTYAELEILYHTKGIKNSLTFNQFLQLLPTIGLYLNDQLYPEQSMKKLIGHMLGVYDKNVYAQLQGRLIDFDDSIMEDTREFILKLAPDFLKIYKIYFPCEYTVKSADRDIRSQSFDAYMVLLKQFQIFPKLLTTKDAFYIFNEVCDAPPNSLLQEAQYSKNYLEQLGNVFRLSKFIESFIAISRICLSRLKSIQNMQQWDNKQKQILKILLEYMQTIKCLKKKPTKFQAQRFSFIVYQQYTEQRQIKSVTMGQKIIKQSADKLRFYNILEKLEF